MPTRGAVAMLATACLLAGCGSRQSSNDSDQAVGDWKPVFKGGVLQPLPDGFPNQRLTLLNADEAGSSDGIYARSLQKALDGVSPVDVEVLDRPSGSGGSWASLKYMESKSESDDGYILQVMAFTGAGLDFISAGDIPKQYGYAQDDMNPVIATESVPFVVVTRGDGPWDTYQDLVDDAKAHPDTLKYVSVSTGSQLDVGMMSLMAEGGWTANKVPLKDNVQVATTVAAGEGDFSMELPDVIAGQYQAGRINVPLVVGDKVPDLFTGAQTTADLGLDEPWGSLRGLMADPDTSPLHRQWLFTLLQAAEKTDAYQQRISDTPGATLVTYDHDAVVGKIDNAIELATPVLKELGLYTAP
jgi:tripartite-type tricarboxylate transporter receptor subunit TctC